MLGKKVLKDIESLRLKKFRDETRTFVAEGPKLVEELMEAAPQQVMHVLALEEWAKGKSGVQVVSETELARLSSLKTPNQVVAVLKQFDSKEPDASGFTLYLDTIQDPGNLGTIVRIADWFGVNDIVCSIGCADLYNPKVVQATMASIARVNVFYDKEENWLQKQSVPVYAASLNGQSLYSFPKTTSGILLIGNESKGLRRELLSLATNLVTIPRKGGAESLNAAVATGIILSHLTPGPSPSEMGRG
jgi:RNA methyltransferase, TrmH family